MTRTTVGILGLGNIGMMYDYHQHDRENYYSHAKSFYDHPDFDLTYLIDTDVEKLLAGEKRYGDKAKTCNNILEIDTLPEILVLAADQSTNRNIFSQLKESKEVKLFILEKPFWNSELEYVDLESYSEKCIVNYPRKYLPHLKKVKSEIQAGAYGKPLGVHLWYSKGLRNNGSHLIDLIHYLLGGQYDLESVRIFNQVFDHNEEDPSIGFSIEYQVNGEQFPVVFQTGNEKNFSLIELDIILEKSRFRFYNFSEKVETYRVEKDPVLHNYSNLVSADQMSLEANKYGYFMCDYISDFLKNKVHNISSLENEYMVYNVIDSVKKGLKHN
jgi:predicted dehydrogenase